MVLATGIATILLSCHGENGHTQKPTLPAEQTLEITAGGYVENHPEEGTLKGTCGPTDHTRSEMSCDVYNGLSNWKLTMVTIALTWLPYREENERVFRVHVTIAPLSTERVTFKLGLQLPPDEVIGGHRLAGWAWAYGPVRAYRNAAAK
jgi:hypothetical protein